MFLSILISIEWIFNLHLTALILYIVRMTTIDFSHFYRICLLLSRSSSSIHRIKYPEWYLLTLAALHVQLLYIAYLHSSSEIYCWNMELSMEHRICRRDEIIIKVSRVKPGREFLPLQRDCRETLRKIDVWITLRSADFDATKRHVRNSFSAKKKERKNEKGIRMNGICIPSL